MRILSSAEKCRRVARRIFFTTSVAGSFSGTDFCLIFAPCEGYDEPEILPSSTHPICLMSADGGQSATNTSLLCGDEKLAQQSDRHDTWSTTARSGDEVVLIRDAVSHCAPVLIAQNSPRQRPWRARIFSIGEGCRVIKRPLPGDGAPVETCSSVVVLQQAEPGRVRVA